VVLTGDAAIVELLLKRDGVDPDSKDNSGLTPLSWAAGNKDVTIVQLLLKRDSVHPDSKDSSGRTPLSWAAEKGTAATFELLLEKDKVNPTIRDRNDRTALSLDASNSFHQGALLEHSDTNENCPLQQQVPRQGKYDAPEEVQNAADIKW
jgi:ankyrin repeat protein